jgi:hypothetical protein
LEDGTDMSSLSKKTLFVIGLSLWFAAVAQGMKWMSDYSLTPGEAGVPSASWPAAEIRRGEGRFTLVVGLHPECPCSRATMAELERVLLEAGDALEAVVVFDDTAPAAPARSSALYRRATQLPRTRVVCATSVAELKGFDFRTSGETRLYRPDGTLAFRGGITASRGHEGENVGAAAVVSHAHAELCGTSATPAFGCALASDRNALP